MLGMNESVVDLSIAGLVRHADDGEWRRGAVLIQGERIAGFSDVGAVDARAHIDVGDAYLLPGMVDAHVHCLSNPGEGIAAATSAAAAGGVTTIVEMPFDQAGPIDSAERVSRKRELVEQQAVVDVALLGTVAPRGGWRAVPEMADAGVCGFKVSLFDTDPYRFPRIDDGDLLDIFAAIADVDLPVCVHAENNEIVKGLIARLRSAGDTKPGAHLRSRPAVSETLAVLAAAEAAFSTGAQLHVCHLSLPRSVDLVRRHVADGLNATTETCPHYLLFTADDVEREGARLKINPPLRGRESQQGLWDRVTNGTIDVISSDHAPWSMESKSNEDIFDNHSGVPGVETILPCVLAEALRRGPQTAASAIDAMTWKPAQRFGLGDRKGRLEVGYDADVVAFDPAAAWHIDEAELHSNARWSPFHGRTNQGRVVLTVSRGQVAWDGQTLRVEPGHGRVLMRNGAERNGATW